ncbi:hypothetical protein D0T49_09540 [Paludibacter sp. 221]|uniref:hypothetical protein n=1 Tax=Paludibacter sp. 221 TaxID=2302939 RepID=UPI0013D101E3|nr:hypothetical protein [Paludibacter sp. 221]NDV47286.1 hypothetical protein [Paludibacter sp. 221]
MRNRSEKKALGLLIFLVVFAGVAAIVMLLWNALIPAIIGWSAINYWQSAGLLVLCKLLIGGFGKMLPLGGGYMFARKSKKWGHMNHEKMMHFHDHFHEKMDGMSPDERREYIRNRMKGFERDCWDYNNPRAEKNAEGTAETT